MSSTIDHVGFIGMGIMGSAMAANLLKAGFRVTVWNRTPGKCEALQQQGAAVAASPANLARSGAEVICTCVSDTPDVEEVLFGPQGVGSGAKPGLIAIDHSTISPTATQDFARRLAVKQVMLLDAPVSGGDVGARNATLTIMVGGPTEAFGRALPVLKAMGKAVTHVGTSGMGQVCKACNQVIVSCALMGVCEALALAKKMGLDQGTMIEVISAGAGQSWQLANLGPKVVQGDFKPGFMVDLLRKDLGIVAAAAGARGLGLNGTHAAQEYLEAVSRAGGGRQGTQAMIKGIQGGQA